MSQAALAEKLGVAQRTVSAWECGNTVPYGRIIPLAAALGISPEKLFAEPPTVMDLIKAYHAGYAECAASVTSAVRMNPPWSL
jgi:transcriptional regulator with XRE-family HTH domain